MSKYLVLTCIAVLIGSVAYRDTASRPSIVIDGDLSDWSRIAVADRDAHADDGRERPVDLREVRLAADSDAFYLLVEFAQPVYLFGLPGQLSLLLDADGDATTGVGRHGLAGVDVAVTFSPAVDADGRVRHIRRFPDSEVGTPMYMGASVAPQFAATHFELRLSRSASLEPGSRGFGLFGERATFKITYSEEDRVQDELGPVQVVLPAFAPAAAQTDERISLEDPIARDPRAAFRVVVWNVNGLRNDRRAGFTRVLAALQADVLMFNQLDPDEADGMAGWLPGSAGRADKAWTVRRGPGTAVAIQGPTAVAFDRVEYPTDGWGDLQRRLPAQVWDEMFAFGVPAFGVTASLDKQVVLSVPLTLRAGGGNSSSRGWVQRKIEATAIHSAVREAMASSRPAALLLGGDLNLYGERDPLSILEQGLDVDGSTLAAVNALGLDGWSNMTYPSGENSDGRSWPWQERLDLLLYSDSSLEPVRAFVFDSRKLSPYWLNAHRLSVDVSDRDLTSDHLPIVVDFRWR